MMLTSQNKDTLNFTDEIVTCDFLDQIVSFHEIQFTGEATCDTTENDFADFDHNYFCHEIDEPTVEIVHVD